MTVSTTDEEEAIRLKLADFARIWLELESLGATIPGQDDTDPTAAPTMPEAAATAGTHLETGTPPIPLSRLTRNQLQHQQRKSK